MKMMLKQQGFYVYGPVGDCVWEIDVKSDCLVT